MNEGMKAGRKVTHPHSQEVYADASRGPDKAKKGTC